MHWDGTISFGSIVEMFGLLIGMISAQLAMHRANKRRMEASFDKLKEVELKVGLMFTWFQKHIIKGPMGEPNGGHGD